MNRHASRIPMNTVEGCGEAMTHLFCYALRFMKGQSCHNR